MFIQELSHQLMILPPLAAIGYSMLYILLGGGLGGALVVFLIARLFGK